MEVLNKSYIIIEALDTDDASRAFCLQDIICEFCFNSVFGEKFHNGLEVFLIIDQIDEAVTGSGYGNQLLGRRTNLIDFTTHVAGNVIIRFSVEENNG